MEMKTNMVVLVGRHSILTADLDDLGVKLSLSFRV
jgi:hypothetical protein